MSHSEKGILWCCNLLGDTVLLLGEVRFIASILNVKTKTTSEQSTHMLIREQR